MNRCCGRTLRNRQDQDWHKSHFHNDNLNPTSAGGLGPAASGNLDQAYAIFKEKLEAAQKVAAEAVRELRQLKAENDLNKNVPGGLKSWQ